MLVGFLRHCKGYVVVRVEGKFPERFLNLAAQRGIAFWDAHPTRGGIEGAMYVADYKKVRKTARKARVRTRILSKHGFPLFVSQYKNRAGLPIGAALGAILLLVLSNFIWTLSFTGLHSLSDERFYELLSENGVTIGALRAGIDVGKAERSILLEVDELTWMSINLLGSHASVEVKEKTQKPELFPSDMPCNIKARCDGVITKINAAHGMAEVKVGSGVAQGDLLVSGISLSKLNTVRYIRADAEVYADVYSKKELNLPKQFNYYSATENKTDRLRLRFLGAEIPFSLSFINYPDSARTYRRDMLVLNDTALPLGFVTETSHEIEKNEETIDKQRAEKIFRNSLLLYEVFEKGESTLADKNLTISETENGYQCTAEYVFNENIAESAAFDVTESE